MGRADGGVDRTPCAEPLSCGACAARCLGRFFGCQLCAHFCLCAVCFAAHVRLSAEQEHGSPEHGDMTGMGTGTGTQQQQQRSEPAPNEQQRQQQHEAPRQHHSGGASGCTDTNGVTAANDMDEDDNGDGDDSDGGDGGGEGSDSDGDEFVGVHAHPPQAFIQQGDGDQEMLEEMIQERQAMLAEAELHGQAAAAAAAEVAAYNRMVALRNAPTFCTAGGMGIRGCGGRAGGGGGGGGREGGGDVSESGSGSGGSGGG